jgi:hypothetical protein
LSNNAIGGLIALWKGGSITRDSLTKRWLSTFDNQDKVYKARQPMSDPFLLLNGHHKVVFGVANGRTVLYGAGSSTTAWIKSIKNLKVEPTDYF